ncbi:fumarylacetoacetate hydrolase family protein [Algicella marina]|uniref:2-hydroxyhepta-2,4-diene-1,7-dioate isomerase n=1 Tax=Algicella marina TaxID=2683284 RepID=A0A6P1T138_9RHOB|nr:fumarylacetoacetate hydrolase family protein [Algicella marina]QHQ35530.1 2-hydroxyhepta-2,4-diene-1,7-dioate isomerase [Algicella marina]
MKLLRWGPKGSEKPGALDGDGVIRDLSAATADFNGDTVSLEALDALKKLDLSSMPVVPKDTRIGCILADVPNFFCIGLNYREHAVESNLPIPEEPIIFSKATSALSGPFDDVILPKGCTKGDWEVELGIVIGRECSYVGEDEALDYVAGYCTINDVSERAFQAERGGQWIKGKSCPTFGPCGPYLVTADEVPDPQTLGVELTIDGEVQQKHTTADMIFTVKEIISYMSQFMTLRVGDIIATGTPQGVGMGQKPPRYLKAGEVMEIEVEGLGRQRQVVKSYAG